jgi:hypothetical protein
MSQLQRLIAKFDALPLETEITVPEIQALGIGPYSRRLEDARAHYLPLGFLILNRMQRRPGQSTLSWYRKVRGSDYPAEYSAATAKAEREGNRVVVPPVSSRQERLEKFEKQFRPVVPNKSTTELQPDFQLTP